MTRWDSNQSASLLGYRVSLCTKCIITVLFLIVGLDSLHPINNLSVIKGWVFLGWTSTKLGLMFLPKDTTQWRQWGLNPPPSVSSQALYHWATALVSWPGETKTSLQVFLATESLFGWWYMYKMYYNWSSFDSLRPSQKFSVMSSGSSWVEPVLSRDN